MIAPGRVQFVDAIKRLGKFVLFALFMFLICLTTLARGETVGPGWFMVEAEPVPLDEARDYYGSQPVDLRTLDASLIADPDNLEIEALARALKGDPRLIYEFVHNHVDYVPYYGALKGATLTLLDRSGNDFDQAALMIALLRESGLEAQFIFGEMTIPNFSANDPHNMMNWLGIENDSAILRVLGSGGIPAERNGSSTTLHRVWVSATIDGFEYEFDPAFKVYEKTPGLNLADAMRYNQTDVLSDAGGEVDTDYVRNLNESGLRELLDDYTDALISYLRTNNPNDHIEEIIGGRKIVAEYLEDLPTGPKFPHEIMNFWTDIPDVYQHTIRITHGEIDQTHKD